MCALHCALCTALNFIASAHECKIHCLLASVNFMLALLSQNFLVSSGKLILPKMLRISQQKNSKARSRCFQVPQHTKSLYQLKNKIYLFRFGHTNALLFQKKITWNGHFPPPVDPYVWFGIYWAEFKLIIITMHSFCYPWNKWLMKKNCADINKVIWISFIDFIVRGKPRWSQKK